ncbi:ABC transporter ATP-binding protein, partial [Streptomyces sp. AV19]|nr:ABC transporter ATP-binding protein [Streptomyces sp. AV19]
MRSELSWSGLRFLAARRGALARLGAWSALEAAHTFAMGYALAHALDGGFLAGRTGAGLGWLAVAALAVLAGAYGTGRTYPALAAVVEPLRDALVRRVVARALRDGDGAAVSRLTHQVEIARDAFAGLLMVTRSFVFTAAGALTGLFLLAPALLPLVAGPLALGLALFLVTLRVLARRQEAFLVADEAIARSLGEVCQGLRDVAAGGAEARVGSEAGALVDAQRAAAGSLARWSVARVVALTVAGRVPVVLLLVSAPWLLEGGVTPGALVGALAYLTQSLLPAVQDLVRGVGASGARLAVVAGRLMDPTPSLPPFPQGLRPRAPPRARPAPPGAGGPPP